MNKVYYFQDKEKLPIAMQKAGIDQFTDKNVLVKLHMGEIKNEFFTPPDFVKKVVDQLHSVNADPFLYDTTVLYNSLRKSVEGYKKVAKEHQFTVENVGCPVEIDKEGIEVSVEDHTFEVGTKMHDAHYIVAISHVKGHIASGMGGVIKNFGMGGVTRNSKRMIHHGSRPNLIADFCTHCGTCEERCPFDAIIVKENEWKWKKNACFGCGVCVENCPSKALEYRVDNFQHLLACAAKACLKGKKALFINDVNRIAKSCDCDPSAGPIICDDVGYFVSTDPVAVDKASLDLIDTIQPDLFQKVNHIDPYQQVRFADLIGLGSSSYELVKL